LCTQYFRIWFQSARAPGVEAGADLALAGGGHLVVMHLDRHAHLFHGQAHGRAQVVQRVDRRHREVAALDARPVAHVAVLEDALGVPVGLVGVDLVEGAAHVGTPAHVVEDEELGLGTEEGGIGDAGGLQVGLGALGDRAGSRS
jgi:hypothetical protein